MQLKTINSNLINNFLMQLKNYFKIIFNEKPIQIEFTSEPSITTYSARGGYNE